MIRPVKSYTRISTRFAETPNPGTFGKHLGTDYATPTGTPVYAPVSGVITQVSTGAAGGKTIEMLGASKLRRFLHLSRQDVRVGQTVSEGQLIGLSGATGHVSGAHLHYDVRKEGTTWNASFSNYIDPEAELIEANKPKPAPASSWKIGDQVWLHAVPSWKVYPVGAQPLSQNAKGTLSPGKFHNGPNNQPGLTYRVRGISRYANTVTIQTDKYGLVDIYLDKDASKV